MIITYVLADIGEITITTTAVTNRLKFALFFDLPIAIGFSLPPAALTKNAYAILSFDFSLQYTALIPRLEICLEVLEKIVLSR